MKKVCDSAAGLDMANMNMAIHVLYEQKDGVNKPLVCSSLDLLMFF